MTPLWSPEVEARVRAEAHDLDPQKRPEEIRFCTRCVVSNQRPRIVFDEEGVCSACRYAERKRNGIDWAERDKQLKKLLAYHRRTRGYDVIVPCSGGKDSATIAHRLKHEYGMHPLCVKFAPFMYTDIGRRNFEAFVQSGFDCVVGWPNGLMHRRLARLSLEYLGDPFHPFVLGQLAFPMQTAAKYGIPLVMYGENGEAEYGGDPAANDKPCWDAREWDRVYLKSVGVARLLDLGKKVGAFTSEEAERISEFYWMPPQPGTGPGPEFHWFGYYRHWHPQANFYYAAEHTGFNPAPERSGGTFSRYASLDDKMDGLHYYMAYIKFGIGRCTSDAAHEVRDGDLTRDEAVALVKRFDGEYPVKHLPECLDYLGIDERHLHRIIDRFLSPAVWRKDGHHVDLRFPRRAVWYKQEDQNRAA